MQVLIIAVASLLTIAQEGIFAVPHSVSLVNLQPSGDSFFYSTYQLYPSPFPVYQQQPSYPIYQQQQQTPVLTSIYQGGAIYHTIPGIQFTAPGAAPVGIIGAAGYPVDFKPAIIGGPVVGQPVRPVQSQEPQVPIGVVLVEEQHGRPVKPVGPPVPPPIGPQPFIPDGPITDDEDTVAIESA